MQRFFARVASDQDLIEVSARSPLNPFCTVAFAVAHRELGGVVWVLGLEGDSASDISCVGVMRSGRLDRALALSSVPDVPQSSLFWSELDRFVGQERVSTMELLSFGGTAPSIPQFRGEYRRYSRQEFQVELPAFAEPGRLSDHHRRAVNRASKCGLAICRSRSLAALDLHLQLATESLDRRRKRQEVIQSEEGQYDLFAAWLKSGAGELYQAVFKDSVVSSMLVLRSVAGAYYVSGGTSDAGRTMRASHWLLYKIGLDLGADGVEVFNLGGVREGEDGLRAFKLGFGATAIELQTVCCQFDGWLRRNAVAMIRKGASVLR